MDYQIRSIQANDNEAIEAVIRACLIEYDAAREGTAWADPYLNRLSEVYEEENTAYWVITNQDDKIVGGLGIGPLEGEDHICELQKMYLMPEARGQGIASLAIEKALTFAKKYYDFCYLETLSNMKEAQARYESFGFKRLDKPLGHTDHHLCDVCYLKDLSQE